MFGLRLKTLRESQGLTQSDLAIHLNTARSTITAYENETNEPSIDMLIKISDIFGVSLDYILGKTEQKYNVELLDKSTNNLLMSVNLLDKNTKKLIMKISKLKDNNKSLLLKICDLINLYEIIKK